MSGIRLNVAALVGSFVLLAVSALVDPAIEDRARAGGGWNTAYLVVPCLQGILTVMSLVGLSLSLRHRQFLDPVIMTAMVVLITLMQIDASVSGFRHYSTRMPS